MAWYDFFTGTPERNEQVATMNPQQQNLQQQSIQQIMSLLQGQPSQAFAPIAQQARTQFNQQTVPGLAERFTSMGSGSSLSSPAFASQLGQAGAGLEGTLAALGSQFGQNQLQSLLPFASQPSFQNLFHQREPSGLSQLISPALQLLLAYGTGGASSAIPALTGAVSSMGNNQKSSASSGFMPQQNSGFGQGFANPSLYGSGMQNMMRGLL